MLQLHRGRGECRAVRPRAGDPGDAHRPYRRHEGERQRRRPAAGADGGATILVGGQVTVSVVVLVVAMFMYRAFGAQLVERPRLSNRSPADDGFRPEPGALLGGAVAAVLPAGRRARACSPRRHERHDDDVDSDVERLDRHRDDCAGRLSVPRWQGQRHDSLFEGGRTLFRHDGHPAAPGPRTSPSTTTATRRAWPSSTSNSPGTTGRIRIRSASGFG